MDFVPKTNWQDEPSTATPVTAAELIRMENGIAEGARDASESVKGNVELATSVEMTTGTDLLRVPSVKRVVDYVATAIEAGLASLPSQSSASETTQGLVELATTGEMTTGTDAVRVPSVARVAGYVTTAINAATATINASITSLSNSTASSLANKADKTGSVNQFADVDDSTPLDTSYLRYDFNSSIWRPYDITDQFAQVDVSGRIVPTAQPQYYVPLLVINENESVPSSYPTGGIVLSRPLAASIVPALIGQGTANASTTVQATLTDSVAVGEYLIYGIGADGSTVAPATFPATYTIAISGTGAAAASLARNDGRSGTCQSHIFYAKCTSPIAAGSVITVTANAQRPQMQLTIAKVANLFQTFSGSLDQVQSTNDNNSSLNMALPATSATSQPSEIAFAIWSWSAGAAQPTPIRTISPGSGWTQLGSVLQTGTTTWRASMCCYRVLTSPGAVTATALCTSSDGTTGPWSGAVATLRAG
jgi:hypothetical protein